MTRLPHYLTGIFLSLASILPTQAQSFPALAKEFQADIRPLVERFCVDCHDPESFKGDLDLDRFTELKNIRHEPAVWQEVMRQVESGEMPPEKKKQPTDPERAALLDWVKRYLHAEAIDQAGDPGPVVLRRLSNAEYTYTLRDLTGVDTLDPAKTFPVDGAAGEGFTNTGDALVMSPGLFTKYFDAAKAVAEHAVLLPDTIRFSPYTTRRDLSDDRVARIQAFYRKFTADGGGDAVDLQGIKFETNQGGLLPLKPYIEVSLKEREALKQGAKTVQAVAQAHQLSPKYLGLLWKALNLTSASTSRMNELRRRWRDAQPSDAAAITAWIEEERRPLWKTNKVGQVGKVDGATRWLEAVSPESAQKLDADMVPYLSALAENFHTPRPVEDLAKAHDVDVNRLKRWMIYASLEQSDRRTITGHLSDKHTKIHGHEPIQGWASGDLPNLLTNRSKDAISFLTLTVPGRGVTTHPLPNEESVLHWQSPIDGQIELHGLVADADNKCGNGFAWRLELSTEAGLTLLAQGVRDKGTSEPFQAAPDLPIKKGDIVSLVINPRDRNHSCDTTQIDLNIEERGGQQRKWQLAAEIVDDVLKANPRGDTYGNEAVWHFCKQANEQTSSTLIPVNSALGSWRRAVLDGKPAREIHQLAEQAQQARGEDDVFRLLFPPALCYAKIVPVDEVVTLTLYYREDDYLQRLMLSDKQTAELNRYWEELRFISHEPLMLLDAYEQLWQYATQDSDPSKLTPMRGPIEARAAQFRKDLRSAEPAHLEAALAFAQKAWRRPVTTAETTTLRRLYKDLRASEMTHDASIRLVLARILVAPDFLYKMEQPPSGKKAQAVNRSERATRLSYFLWSSMPDAELMDADLRQPAVLRAQTQRMLNDPRLRRMAIQFACQWIGVRDFSELDEKSERHFPEFIDLRGSMEEESVRFFTDLFMNDRSILSIIDADHSFIDPKLAAFYGLPAVDGWQRVEGLHELGRGGILGMASTLARQSGASRTSPILRGNWIYEVLLGERLPRPPKDVPQLPDVIPQGITERKLIEVHSTNPACAKCHDKIDPYGFALENFDAIGRARPERDTRARLPDGQEIKGLDGLRDYLLGDRREDVLRQFCRKLLGYALGRGVQLSDEPLLDRIIQRLPENDYRVGVAIDAIVQSPQFQQIRGKDAAFTVSTSTQTE